jgi:hypothetical protein
MTENKFSLIDIGKISKPVTKLIEVVSQGIGTLYEPTKIRRKAKAQADASLIRAEADIKKQELLKRAFNRFAFQEMRRQENIENIIKVAAESLPETVSDDPVDKDWISRFFDECKDVSNEELQKLWGRLLAGEVATPKSCSRKTLAILKDLSPEDAKTFIKFCSFVWIEIDNLYFPQNYYFMPFDQLSIEEQLEKCRLTYGECLHLESLGLIHCKKDISITLSIHDTLRYFNLNHICYERYIEYDNYVGDEWGEISCFLLTQPGIELFSVATVKPDWNYYIDSCKLLTDFFIFIWPAH